MCLLLFISTYLVYYVIFGLFNSQISFIINSWLLFYFIWIPFVTHEIVIVVLFYSILFIL